MKILLSEKFLKKLLVALTCILQGIFTVFAGESKTETVIVDGYGADVPSAAQNAAQNALSQVVGSFVDSTKMLEKQLEIRDGVKSQVKSITTDVKEYSQGSIKKFEVLSVGEQNGLKTVSAKVEVRIDDFKQYIKNIIGGEREFEGTSLFAEASTKTKQFENKSALLMDSIIAPLTDGGSVQYEISAPMSFDKAQQEFFFNPIGQYSFKAKKLADAHGIENLYVFEVVAMINQDFIENMNRVLDSIADVKKEIYTKVDFTDTQRVGSSSSRGKVATLGDTLNDNAGRDGYFIILHDGRSHDAVASYGHYWEDNLQLPSTLYILKNIKPKLKNYGELGDSLVSYPGPLVRNLSVQIVSHEGIVLQESSLGNDPHDALAVGSDYTSKAGFSMPWQMYMAERSLYHGRAGHAGIGIMKRREFKLLVAINQDAIRSAKKVVLRSVE